MAARTFRCLSVRQPWVWAIFHAGKDIENRDWKPTNPGLRVRGRVLIHAAAGMSRAEWDDALSTMHGISYERPFPDGLAMPAFDELPRGCLYGGVTIVDCVRSHSSPWFFGEVGLVLSDPKPLPRPIPYKGQLGFFGVPESALVEPGA